MSNDRNRSFGAPASRLEGFARWRRERPFWGALLTIVAGVEIYSAAAAPMNVVVMQGLPGLLTIVVALVAVIMGAVTMAQPPQRVITGWVILVLGPLSILATNLGGFVVGMILLVVGGSLILSWQPPTAQEVVAPAVPARSRPRTPDEIAPEVGYEPDDVTRARAARAREAVFGAPEDRGDVGLVPGFGVAGAAPALASSTDAAPSHAIPDETVVAAPYVEAPYSEAPYTEAPYTAAPYVEAASADAPGADAEPVTEVRMRNPWRSTRPVAAEVPPAAAVPAPEPVAESTTVSAPEHLDDPSVDPSTGRSWFDQEEQRRADAATPSAGRGPGIEPPAMQARSTLAIPVILMIMLATALGAGPASAETNQSAGFFDWLLNPTPSATAPAAPAPSATPTPTPGFVLPTLPTLPGLPGSGDGAGAETPIEAPPAAATCPTENLPAGTTSGGAAAIDAAAAIQACLAADSTATVNKAATAPNISGQLTTLYSPRLEMSGFSFNGVKSVSTNNGTVRLLSFSVDKLVIDGFDHRIPFSGGETKLNNTGSQLVATGNVQLYVASMKGKIYGLDLLNLTFTPDFAPPLVLPSMFFTDTTSKVAYFSADKITLPTLKITVDKG